jgi:protein-S-isoprenylcysteine O-methyltransferase Ste14
LNTLIRKTLYVIGWYMVYPQAWYLWLAPELFTDHTLRLMLAAILVSYVIGILDTYFRPFSENIRGDFETNPMYSYTMVGLFLLNPLFVVAASREQAAIAQLLPVWGNPLVSVAGIVLLITGGAVTVAGRAQLGKYGSGIIQIEEGHRLVTTGIYGLIRRPIYGGGLVGLVGLYLAFRSLIVLVAVTAVYFVVIKHRLLFEERMLMEEFGDEYKAYMKKTRRLIPYVY